MNLLYIIIEPINLTFIIIIVVLALIDIFKKKDLKSSIVSVGVLGTFFGIFIGLQEFNIHDIKSSIPTLLSGLKTAFITSIVGMFVSITLTVIQKIFNKDIDDSDEIEKVLNRILDENLKSNETLERVRLLQSDSREESKNISYNIEKLRDNQTNENQKLISILDTNFEKMNTSLEKAIEKLSEGATKEIIKALEDVIQDFNNKLTEQFGENFKELNSAVLKLVTWQENYKNQIIEFEDRLKLALISIEKSKESLEVISSKNEDIKDIYYQLGDLIKTYDIQVKELNKHLEVFANLSDKSKDMFNSIEIIFKETKNQFIGLSEFIANENHRQNSEFEKTTNLVKNNFENLTKTIEDESKKQIENFNENRDKYINDLQKQKEEINKTLQAFNEFTTQIKEKLPKSLETSLNSLDSGLATITNRFKQDYEEFLNLLKKLK